MSKLDVIERHVAAQEYKTFAMMYHDMSWLISRARKADELEVEMQRLKSIERPIIVSDFCHDR